MRTDTSDEETDEEVLSAAALESQLEQVTEEAVETLAQKEAEIERLQAELTAEREQRIECQEQFEAVESDVEELRENYVPIHAVETVLAKQGVSKDTVDDVIEAARAIEDNAEANVSE
ncbi:hypothetical protein [Salinibaculum rarum]|jgi:chromosome segregation ATPase|uniref:hypothetical protein n=1 Tax=Salinibaculum rarum TaxID=3058903 RepID=UPI00265DA764|nr:hypothetical protein [Salinibaculum sp. KK48]